MHRLLWAGAGCAAGLAAGIGFGVYQWRSATTPFYVATRSTYLSNQIAQAGPFDTLVLGDSISESTFLDDVCGSTFNASVGGSTIPPLIALAKLAIPRMKPKTIIIQTGRNYFHYGDNPAFERDFAELLKVVAGHRLILVGVPLAPKESEFVRREAKAIGAKFVMPALGSLTKDGVHPTPAGGLVYRQRIAEACAAP